MLSLIRTVGRRNSPLYNNYSRNAYKIVSIPVFTSRSYSMNAQPTLPEDEKCSVVARLKYAFNEDLKKGQVVPVYKRALLYGDNAAIKDHQGEFSYMQIYQAAKRLSFQLSNLCGSGSSSRVAFLCDNSALYTVIQWACWFSGQIGKGFLN